MKETEGLVQRKRVEKRREGRRSKEEVKKGEEETLRQRWISGDHQEHQHVSWSTLDTIQPRPTAKESCSCQKSFEKLLAGVVKCREVVGRSCEMPSSSHLHSHHPTIPSHLRPHCHLQKTPSIGNYGPKPRSTVKIATSRQKIN